MLPIALVYVFPLLACQYNYTIGINYSIDVNYSTPIIINQSDPVCLICSNISNSLWMIDHVNTPPIPAAPYIPYVPFPATTFLSGPTVACYSVGMADIV